MSRIVSIALVTFLSFACADPGVPGEARAQARLVDFDEVEGFARPPASEALSAPEVLALRPYRDIPAVARALELFVANDSQGCVDVLERWRKREEHPAAKTTGYLLLVCRHFAGRHEQARTGLMALSKSDPLLADYARYFAAKSAAELGRTEEVRRLVALIPADSSQRQRALQLLPSVPTAPDDPSPDESKPLTTEEKTEHARALYRAHQSREAIAVWEKLAKAEKRGSALWCEAHYMVARSWDKLRQRKHSVSHYDDVVAACPHDEARAAMLFFGGKSAHQEGLRDRALKLFATLHREFPEHSFNDDALLREADVHFDEKRPTKARGALERAVREYPEGDMREDAAWLLQWEAWERGAWTEALKRGESNLKLIPREKSFRSRGRTLYWIGRAHQKLGRRKKAEKAFERCIRAYPLSWYGSLAYARLHKRSARLAKRTLARAIDADRVPPDPLSSNETLKVTTTAEFQRAIEFLRLGLTSPASWELARVPRDDESAGTDWLLARLWEKAGVYVRSHNIARRRRPEYAEHFPKDHHERLWQIAYPRPFRSLAGKAAEAESIPEALIHAIMREESGFDAGIESWANAIGLMQLLVPTARDQAKPEDGAVNANTLRGPRLNTRLGARFLAKLYHGFRNHPSLAAAGYNAGKTRLKKWMKARGHRELDEFVETIPYRQTRGYTKRVTESFLRYQYLYGPNAGELPVLPLKLR